MNVKQNLKIGVYLRCSVIKPKALHFQKEKFEPLVGCTISVPSAGSILDIFIVFCQILSGRIRRRKGFNCQCKEEGPRVGEISIRLALALKTKEEGLP